MNVFSNVQLNASVLPYTNTTLAKTTNSITVTNFSHLNLSVGSSVTPGYGVMPPFSTQSFSVTPNEQITWQMQDASVPPTSQANEYVSYTESVLHYASGLQMLAQLPLYDITVNGALNITSGTVDATITNATLDVNVPNGVQINNNSLNVVTGAGSQTTVANTVDITMTGSTVTQDANVINDWLSTSPLCVIGAQSKALTLPANGYFAFFNIASPLNSIYDQFYIVINSPQGYMTDITLGINGLYYHNPDIQTLAPSSIPNSNSVPLISYSGGSPIQNGLYGPITIPPTLVGLVALQLNNTTSIAITDTFTATVYGRYASNNIINTTSSPVNTQSVAGVLPNYTFVAPPYNSGSFSYSAGSSTNTIITRVFVSINNNLTTTSNANYVTINLNGVAILTIPIEGNLTSPINQSPVPINLGDGVPTTSTGLTITGYISGTAGDIGISVSFITK